MDQVVSKHWKAFPTSQNRDLVNETPQLADWVLMSRFSVKGDKAYLIVMAEDYQRRSFAFTLTLSFLLSLALSLSYFSNFICFLSFVFSVILSVALSFFLSLSFDSQNTKRTNKGAFVYVCNTGRQKYSINFKNRQRI